MPRVKEAFKCRMDGWARLRPSPFQPAATQPLIPNERTNHWPPDFMCTKNKTTEADDLTVLSLESFEREEGQ